MKRLLLDVEPFFHGRPVVYVDAGAHKGDSFRKVHASSLTLRAAHLFEPNPASFAALEATVRELGAEAVATCHNVALAAAPQRLRLSDAGTMTKVVGPADDPRATGDHQGFEVEAVTLDMAIEALSHPHVSILKADVEGYEREVLGGASALLGRQAVDLIYVEAGIDPAGAQHTYYREVEDALRAQGYRLFRFYEHTNDWIENSPLVRCVNLAFLSEAFAAKSPYKLSPELLTIRRKCWALKQTLAAEQAAAGSARSDAQDKDRALADLREEVATLREGQDARERESERRADALQRDLEALCREASEQDARARTLIDEMRAREAKGAAQVAALEAALASQKALRDDLSTLRAYAADLERRLQDVLGSTTWMVMEPVRRVVRLVRRQKAPHGIPTLADRQATSEVPEPVHEGSRPIPQPALPEGKPLSAVSSAKGASVSEQACELIRLSGQMAIRDLLAAERRLAGRPNSPDTFFLSRFARMLAHVRYSAHSEVVSAVDAITDRLGSDLRWIEDAAGAKVLVRFTIVAASSLTRVHRYEEARQLIDEVIRRRGGRPELLRCRAQMCWPHDPDQTRADLEECARRGELPDDWRVLQAYLKRHLPPGTPDGDMACCKQDRGGQTGLVLALAALDRGDFDAYRAEVNAFFEGQDLLGPVPADASRFEFANLEVHPEAARTTAGPRVSVIMTTFNSAAMVGYAVRSILAQTHANLELLVVDDLSSDETPRVLAGLEASDPRIRVLRNDVNVGTYLSKNRAMEQAAGDYVTFHDSDDWAHPERLARHVRLMEDDRNLVASRSEWLRVSDGGPIMFHRWGHTFQHVNPASMFLRREAVEAIGYFDGVRYGADSEYWYRLHQRFGRDRMATLPLCLGLGASHGASLTQSGEGALGPEKYSPSRGAYAASYMEWHATADAEALRRPAAPADRAFWAPPEMVVRPAILVHGQLC